MFYTWQFLTTFPSIYRDTCFLDVFSNLFYCIRYLLDSSRCLLAATDPMGKSSNIFHPGAPPIPTAAAFRVCHELSCTRRSAGSKERCCRGAHFCIFLLGEFGVVIKGRCRREKLHPSPLGGGFSIDISDISLVFQPVGMFGIFMFQPHQVALQRLKEQRVELEREIQEAKDALEKLRTEAASVEHSLLRQHWNVVSHFVCKVCIDGQMLPNSARLLGNWLYWSEVNNFKLLKDYYSSRFTRISINKSQQYRKHEGISTFVVPPCQWGRRLCASQLVELSEKGQTEQESMKKELERLEERLKEVSASILGRNLKHFGCKCLCVVVHVGNGGVVSSCRVDFSLFWWFCTFETFGVQDKNL